MTERYGQCSKCGGNLTIGHKCSDGSLTLEQFEKENPLTRCKHCDVNGWYQMYKIRHLKAENGNMKSQILEAISILESGTKYEKLHLIGILKQAIE